MDPVAPFPCQVCGQLKDGEHAFTGDAPTYWLRPGESCPGWLFDDNLPPGPWIEDRLARQLDIAASRMLAE